VGLLGTALAPAPQAATFAQRQGMLFLGAIHAADSPNLDALGWFLDAVLPRLAEEMEAVPELTVAGYTAAGIDLGRFAGRPGVRLVGEVAETGPLYARARIFVAPTRFAAGTPYKLHEAAAFGLPIVATALLAEQMGWRDGEELLAAPAGDAAGMARRIAQLYRDPIIWNRLRAAALSRIARENAPLDFARAVETVAIGDDFANDAMVSGLRD
ncbi:MAG: glycosyltransferase family 4 protein, partial [Acetobacteraceae bacterium]